MDKLTMAHDYFMKHVNTDQYRHLDDEDLISWSFDYVDAMKAEAEKREDKTRPAVLNMADSPQLEWQPDWSQAPDGAKYWAMDKDGSANFFRRNPEITNGNGWDFGGVMQANNTHGYQGNWQDSLRKRPEALCEVDWRVAPQDTTGWKMKEDRAYWIDSDGWIIEDAPSFGFTGSHIVERPHGF